jgi:hypothetical protein
MNFNFNDLSDDTPCEMQGRKLRRSCELCRGSKGKCIPSGKDMNRCQRQAFHQSKFLDCKGPRGLSNNDSGVSKMASNASSLKLDLVPSE